MKVQSGSVIFHNQENMGSIKTQCGFTFYGKGLKSEGGCYGFIYQKKSFLARGKYQLSLKSCKTDYECNFIFFAFIALPA